MYGKIVSIIIMLITLNLLISVVYASNEDARIIPLPNEYITNSIEENDKQSGFTFEHWFFHFSETTMAIIIIIINPILILINFILCLVSFKKISKRKWFYIFNPIISILLILGIVILSSGISATNLMKRIDITSIIIFIIQIILLLDIIIGKIKRKNTTSL